VGEGDVADDAVISAVIIDDHPAITAGVQAWCAMATPPVRLIDADGRIGRAWTEPGASAQVVIFDLQLGGAPEFRELERLVDAGRQVIVYSQRADRDTVLTCLDLGVFTYLTKAEGPDHLIPAIRAAAADLPYTSPSLGGAISTDHRPNRPQLSEREMETLVAWFESDSKRLVAGKLGVSIKTVETYIDRVRIKYANTGRPARTKAALVERALQDGLIAMEDLTS
jgi:DNA-binding NarL/FixJ family response regulator